MLAPGRRAMPSLPPVSATTSVRGGPACVLAGWRRE